eukprot:gnl/MRDRNA2_/MRDRNA2_29932_c0_seq1.p1 gnl/MRDRNA2_/MRDRNA2_29932_c0~~gnl/MRDRNA2_/MRDRNA2_29932_c0_seq1.p1  ORF type:complete len:324 (+),score=71.06 gnl/MRDRNA2_/MRDRNA2_29932_c0_seq1:58-1029(+)
MGKNKGADALEGLARKAKTAKGRRFLKNRAPKVVENPKGVLFLRGNKSTNDVTGLLNDLYGIRKPLATLFSRKHAEQPFEDISGIEKLCTKLDHSMFCLGSTSKKRPFRLVVGRNFDHQLLDMQEWRISNYVPVSKFGGKVGPVLGSKPLVVFQGAAFDNDEALKRVKSLLLDLLSGPKPEQVLLSGLDQAIVVSTLDGAAPSGNSPAVYVRRYRVSFEKSGSKLPFVKTDEIGPRFDLTVDRQREPDRERWKAAMRQPKAVVAKKIKNVSTDEMGRKMGKIHIGKQEFEKIHTVHHGLSDKSKKDKKGKGADLGPDVDDDDE